jgi:Flp pilus assembly protein TadD
MAAVRKPFWFIVLPLLLLWPLVLSPILGFARDKPPRWILVSSSHFAVLTDADDAPAHEVLVSFEQMSAEFANLLSRDSTHMWQPLTIIAFKSTDEYNRVAPAGESSPGFFVSSGERNFVVLDLARGDLANAQNWHAVIRAFGVMLLNGNYPPTQPWFDEGFADYFASFRPGAKKTEIGNDPSDGAFTTQLSKQKWLSLSNLFSAQPSTPSDAFRAQSWIALHYLISKNKLSETGAYFGLVKMQKLPVDQAIQQAFGMSASQLGQSIYDYYQVLAPKFTAKNAATETATDSQIIATSLQDVKPGTAQASIAEMALRVPGRRPFALAEIQSVVADPKQDNAVAHRALAWDDMQQKQFDPAADQLNQAMQLDPRDPWVRYYLSWLKYLRSDNGTQPIRGLPNMMQDLRTVLDWDPEFAEAYNLLGLARLEGGGVHAAMEAMHAAIQLAPRNDRYLLNMVNIYLSDKKWDAATALLNRLVESPDPKIVATAQKKLTDLPMLKKYGRVPETGADVKAAGTPDAKPALTARADGAAQTETTSDATSDSNSDEMQVSDSAPAPPPPDKRPIHYLKAKLLSVDCTHPPAALLSIAAGDKKITLRAADYKSLVVLGAGEFSCAWTNRLVGVNYKPGGQSDGDVVSLELK